MDDTKNDHSAGLSPIDYWRLCDELDIVQAALLLVGEDPGGTASYVEGWDVENRPNGYEAAKTALTNAVRRGAIDAVVVQQVEHDFNGNEIGPIAGTIDLRRTQVNVHSLSQWLADRGITSGFFMQGRSFGPDYLSPDHPRYAPKLAAAVRAWMEVDDPQGKSPKSALVKWLRENAREFGLSDDEGKPNELGIDECAKVANWQPSGGAPKTPGT
jgi:hypothetical protein